MTEEVVEMPAQDNGLNRGLMLAAFVLNLLTVIAFGASALFTFGISLVFLAWMIPMTVSLWGVYKGKKENTIAFGVCTLIFVNLISGILMLVSRNCK